MGWINECVWSLLADLSPLRVAAAEYLLSCSHAAVMQVSGVSWMKTRSQTVRSAPSPPPDRTQAGGSLCPGQPMTEEKVSRTASVVCVWHTCFIVCLLHLNIWHTHTHTRFVSGNCFSNVLPGKIKNTSNKTTLSWWPVSTNVCWNSIQRLDLPGRCFAFFLFCLQRGSGYLDVDGVTSTKVKELFVYRSSFNEM